MKNRLVMGAAALASLIALGHFGGKPLLAQIRAALVKNIDERGRSPYRAGSRCQGSGDLNICVASFPAVAANRRLVVEYINGNIVAGHGVPIYPGLSTSQTGQNGITLQP